MEPFDHVEDAKKFVLGRLVATGLLNPRPCVICCIVVSPADPTLVYECNIYDGENALGDLKFTLEGQFTPFFLATYHGYYFRRGIYVDFTTNIGSVTVHYDPQAH